LGDPAGPWCRLVLKALGEVEVVVAGAGRQHLDGHKPPKGLLMRPKHRSHAALAQQSLDFILGEKGLQFRH